MILNYLYNSCLKYPDKVAFVDEDKSITYRELLKSTKTIANNLMTHIRDFNKPIIVFIDRNIESLCVFFAILMTRNFYVPLSSDLPIDRINTIIKEINPLLAISFNNCPSGLLDETTILEYNHLLSEERNNTDYDFSTINYLDTDPMYAICTSGTTGIPKAVLISHQSVEDFIPVFCSTFSLDNTNIFGNQAPFDFDVSVKDVYSSLYLGATTVIIPKKCFSLPKTLVEYLDNNKVTTLIWAVSALTIISLFDALNYLKPKEINKIMFSGEIMPIKSLNYWRDFYPDAMFVNLYGPTEITCNCMYYIVDREFSINEKLPLGVPFKNEGVYFLNEDNEEIKKGEIGEICITGRCLAIGYYNNKNKTSEVFVQNPLNPNYYERMYKTGDLALLGEDNNYYFNSRKDFQIKHMGHRIELEELETHINSIDNIKQVCCIYDENSNKIVCFYNGDIEKNDIVELLKKKIPKYMFPNKYINMPFLPLNKNGKINRQYLRDIYFSKNEKN